MKTSHQVIGCMLSAAVTLVLWSSPAAASPFSAIKNRINDALGRSRTLTVLPRTGESQSRVKATGIRRDRATLRISTTGAWQKAKVSNPSKGAAAQARAKGKGITLQQEDIDSFTPGVSVRMVGDKVEIGQTLHLRPTEVTAKVSAKQKTVQLMDRKGELRTGQVRALKDKFGRVYIQNPKTGEAIGNPYKSIYAYNDTGYEGDIPKAVVIGFKDRKQTKYDSFNAFALQKGVLEENRVNLWRLYSLSSSLNPKWMARQMTHIVTAP